MAAPPDGAAEVLQQLERAGLAVETIHAVHSARPATRADLEADLDFGN
jgi:hypothetical protein